MAQGDDMKKAAAAWLVPILLTVIAGFAMASYDRSGDEIRRIKESSLSVAEWKLEKEHIKDTISYQIAMVDTKAGDIKSKVDAQQKAIEDIKSKQIENDAILKQILDEIKRLRGKKGK